MELKCTSSKHTEAYVVIPLHSCSVKIFLFFRKTGSMHASKSHHTIKVLLSQASASIFAVEEIHLPE